MVKIDKIGNKEIRYYPNNKTKLYVKEYTLDDKLFKQTWFASDGITIKRIQEYTENNILIKKTVFLPISNAIIKIYNREGQLMNNIFTYENGKNILFVDEFDNSGIKTKTTFYNNANKIWYITTPPFFMPLTGTALVPISLLKEVI